MPAGPFILIAVFMMMMMSYCIDGETLQCLNQEQSPLCFCQSSGRRLLLADVFLSKLSLSHCASNLSTVQCRRGRFSPSSMHVTQLIPDLVNHSHCLKDPRCLHPLRAIQRCSQCQIIPSAFSTQNDSYVVTTSSNALPSDSCFYVCEHDRSCGFICFDRRVSITVVCNLCRGLRRNVTCRCAKEKPLRSCVQSTLNTSTPRWMQKRGFPAAAILALMVIITILLIIVMNLINRRIGVLARRQNGSVRRSIATITTYRSRQPSPSIAVSYPNTPIIPPAQLPKDLINASTMVELLNDKAREYVVDVHRGDEEDELSVFLLEKTPALNSKAQEVLDDEDEEEDRT